MSAVRIPQDQDDVVATVLAVDDEEAVLKLMAHHLTDLPCVFIPTLSPAEAILILKTRNVAVLLCDLRMPDIDGNTVLRAAREVNPNIVSIIVTGATDHEATVRAINEGGIWKYISKPWKKEELLSLVNEGVRRYATFCHQQALLTQLARDITSDQTHVVGIKARKKDAGLVQRALRKLGLQRIRLPGRREGVVGNRYRLVEVLGEGGMGTVYRADDLLLNMPVAIKVLGSRFTRDKLAISTLKEEARIAMQLSHRHIVRIHNLQRTGENYFLVMEYVPGRNFRHILKRYGILPLETVLQVVRVCTDALAYAHRHKVLHRDLKPANLMLGEDGVLKIIDFGVACLIGKEDKDNVLGTPVYMSPEQIRGETLDSRTDIYSLGQIVYELLTGHSLLPESATGSDVLDMGMPDLSTLPIELRPAIEKAIAPDRNERWASAEAFSNAMLAASVPLITLSRSVQQAKRAPEDSS